MAFIDIYSKSVSAAVCLNDLIYCDETNNYLYLLAFNKYKLRSDAVIKLSPMPCHCLIISVYGSGILRHYGRSIELPCNRAVVFDCRMHHEIRAVSECWSYYIIYFSGDGMKYFAPLIFGGLDIPLKHIHVSPEFTEDFSALIRLYSLYALNPPQSLSLLVRALTAFCEYSSAPYSDNPDIPDYLIRIKALLEREYYLPHSLDELESKFHMNRFKISKDFTRFFGISPIRYLNSRRIEAAERLLLECNAQINEISSRVGFENTNYFIQLFKKQTGFTPAQYRQIKKSE